MLNFSWTVGFTEKVDEVSWMKIKVEVKAIGRKVSTAKAVLIHRTSAGENCAST